MLTVEEFDDKFGDYMKEEEMRAKGKHDLTSFDWVKFNDVISLPIPKIPKEGWITSNQYQDEYGPPTANSESLNRDVTAIMLVESGKKQDKKYHLDIILKNSKGNRFFYTLMLDDLGRGHTPLMEQSGDLKPIKNWVAWKMPINQATIYFEDMVSGLDITDLFPKFTSSLKTPFLNWYQDNPLELK